MGRLFLTSALALVAASVLFAGDPAFAASCPAVSPTRISTKGLVVDQAWQRYRKLPDPQRCCARVCEPFDKVAARIEYNALDLYAIATNPRVPQSVRSQALRDANAQFKLRYDLAQDFTACTNDMRQAPGRTTQSAARGGTCNAPDDPLGLAWAKWCDGFYKAYEEFEQILRERVPDNVIGTFKITSDYFKVRADGTVDPTTVSILTGSTKLPPGATAAPFIQKIRSLKLGAFPANSGQPQAWMQFVSQTTRAPGPPGGPLTSAIVIRQGCPGPVTKPAN